MKFDNYVNILLEALDVKRTYAILPGGFKPPTKGHFEALKHMLRDADAGVVFIGKKERCGITAAQSYEIWEIYKKYLGKPVTISVAEKSPIVSTYEFADTHSDNIIVGVGPEADANELNRYRYFKQNPEKYPHVEVVNIPAKYNRISGTSTRECIVSRGKSAVDYFVPGVVDTKDRAKIAKILFLS